MANSHGRCRKTKLNRERKKQGQRGVFFTFCTIWPKLRAHSKQPGVDLGENKLLQGIALLQKSCTTSISFNGQLLPTTYTQFLPLIWPSSLKIKLNINIDIHTTVSRQEGIFSRGRALNAQNNFGILLYLLKNSSTPTAWLRHLKTQMIFQSIPSLSLGGKRHNSTTLYINYPSQTNQ